MKNIISILLLCMALTLTACRTPHPNPVLNIDGGKIIGVETPTQGIIAYKGIPFAAPPVGDLRWRQPQPVVPWQGVKVADKYGAAAMQVTWNPDSFYGREWRPAAPSPSARIASISTSGPPPPAAPTKNCPSPCGFTAEDTAKDSALNPKWTAARIGPRGVILVSVTYRLGVMGFFSHPLLSAESPDGVSGNYGLMDQAAALKWIRENIMQFGGDPENITIFGQSAGAGSVQALCASPKSKQFISKAISMSGGGLSEMRPMSVLETAQTANKAMMDHFQKTTLQAMRALSFDELLKMSSDYTAATGSRVNWGPVKDNFFLTGSFSETARANAIPNIPYMFGYTANDMNDMAKPIRDFAALRAEQSDKPVYTYLFTRQLPGDNSGAFHSSDLWYIFHSFRHSWRPFTAGDNALSLQMMDYWTNFAKYGNPNGDAPGLWTPCTPQTPEFMILDANETSALCTMSASPQFKGPASLR